MEEKEQGKKAFWNNFNFFERYKGLDHISHRVAILELIVVGLVIAIFFNLLNLMVIRSDKYQQAAASQQLKTETLPANRGTIFDANGEKLVRSAAAWVVYLAPAEIQEDQRKEICQTLSDVLGLDYNSVLEKTHSKYTSVKLTVKAEKDQKDILQAFIYRTCYVGKEEYTGEDGKKHTRKVVAGGDN